MPWAAKNKDADKILAAYCQKRSAVLCAATSRAGKLWEDDDFESCKFDSHCVEGILHQDK